MSDKHTQKLNHRGHVVFGMTPDDARTTGASAASGTDSRSRSVKSQEQFSQYLSNYRFERDPFSDAGTSGLFFAGGGRKEAVESLLHYSRYGSTPVFLTGHIGCGKTTTLKALISELESDVDVAVVPALLMVTPSQFFMSIAIGFGVESLIDNVMDLAGISQQLLAFFKDNAASERQSFLCIDNVQDLPNDVVRALFELLALAEGSLGVLFVGEQTATAMLEAAAEETDLLLNRIELPVFDQQDVSAYVKYRLDAVGYGGEYPLTAMQLQALSYRSQGSLSQLHSVARSMLIAGMESVKAERSPFPVTHLLALIFLTVLIVLGWRHKDSVEVIAEPEPIVLEPAAVVKALEAERSIDGLASAATQSTIGSVDVKVGAVSDKTAEEVRAALNALANNAAESTSDSDVGDSVQDSHTHLVDIPASVLMAGNNATAAAHAAPALPVENADTAVSSVTEKSVSPAIEQAELALAADRPLAKSHAAHERLMAWTEVGYALQIFGTHNAKRAKQLVEQYFGQADLLFYETRHNGRPWYVVVNGPYSGRDAAKLSIEKLPEGLQRLRPWPRNIASIQADIRRFSAAIAADRASQAGQ